MIAYESFSIASADSLSREQIINNMLKAGVWPFIRQKPYDIIANQDILDKNSLDKFFQEVIKE